VAIDRRQVEHVATLAKLGFTEPELDALAVEMSTILEFFETLGEVGTTDVEPALRVLRRLDVTRADEPGEMFTADEALANAPDRAGNSFRVPAYLPEDDS
jgi:aspartyl-tRNA(Asn)/glutamyl-tRNA(Gln) amidotransferase subunit C